VVTSSPAIVSDLTSTDCSTWATSLASLAVVGAAT
jgi:hypothetical protein